MVTLSEDRRPSTADRGDPSAVCGQFNMKFYHFQLFISFLLSSFLIVSCSTSTPPFTPQIVSVFSSSAAEPWLSGLYNCAAQQNNVVLSRTDDSTSAEIVLQLGEPTVTSFAYQIDTENIVIVMNNVRPPVLNLQQIKDMFTGQITNLNQITLGWGNVYVGESGDIHVWIYSPDSDIQRMFNKLVLEDRPILSSAKLAATPYNMLTAIRDDRSSVGILPQHWNLNHEVFEQAVVAKVPVLAITKNQPASLVKELLACLQK